MQIVDIERPERARIVAVYECGITQGDIQVIRQDDERGKVFATYTADAAGYASSACYQEAEALGFDAMSGSFLYNSNSELMTSALPAIEIFDISDPRDPKELDELPLPTRPGLGTESHDITFNEAGTRAYSAALSQGVIIDTEDPAKPEVISNIVDPSVNVWHQSDPYTVTDADGTEREFLVAEDEVAGALPFPVCPSGGFHIWEITGEMEDAPEKVGFWNIDDVATTSRLTDTCTAGGVRVVDVSALAGIALGETDFVGDGMKELGFFRFTGARPSNAWSAKSPHLDRDGFYLYANDLDRGLDIFKFEGEG